MIGFILQARSTSSRLPGKVLLPFFEEKCILEIIIGNLKSHFPNIPLILATTTNAEDNDIVALGEKLDVQIFRGDELNVVDRTVKAAEHFGIEDIIRVCSDNPFLNMDSVFFLVNKFVHSPTDYLSFQSKEGIPVIRTHLGLFVEVTTLEALSTIIESTEDTFYYEHVTNFIYGNPDQYDVELIHLPEILSGRDDLRFTVDNPNDFEICKNIYSELKDHGQNLEALVAYVDKEKLNIKMLEEIKKYKK